MKDIYTGIVISEGSDEHIIHNFLGGDWKPRGLIDKTTNDQLGAGIDAALHQALQPLIVLIDARTHSEPDRSPRPIKVTGDDEVEYTVSARGVVSAPPTLRFSAEDRKVELSGEARSVKEFHDNVRHWAKRKVLPAERIIDGAEITHRFTAPPKLTFGLDALWASGPRRAIAKIACNLLAAHRRELFESKPFDAIREYVRVGAASQGFVVPSVPLPPATHNVRLGVLDHLCVVTSRPALGTIDAVVVIFGHLAFSIGLATDVPHDFPEFTYSYRVAQLEQRYRRNHVADVAIPMPTHAASVALSVENRWVDVATGQAETVAREVLRIQHRLGIEAAISMGLEVAVAECRRAGVKENTAEWAALVSHWAIEALRPTLERNSRRLHDEAVADAAKAAVSEDRKGNGQPRRPK